MDILIVGGGICGLDTALLLARDGHDVTLLERDASPIPDSPEAACEAMESAPPVPMPGPNRSQLLEFMT